MLVLTRKPGEELIIGDEVRVRVLEIMGQKVRIGITAPRDVSIHRAEIYNNIVLTLPFSMSCSETGFA